MIRKTARFGIIGLALLILGTAACLLLVPSSPVYGTDTVYSLAHRLYSPNPSELKETTEAFQHLGKDAVPSLIRMLNTKDTPIRTWVWEKSGWLDKEKRLFLMRRVPPPQRHTTRLAAIRALGIIGSDAVASIPALEKLLLEGKNENVWPTATTLGKIGTNSVSTLSLGLEHTNSTVREASALALIALGPGASPAMHGLLRSLTDPTPTVRDHSARALAAIGKPALPPLLQIMEGTNTLAIIQALKTVQFMHPSRKTVTPVLLHLLNHPEPQIRADALLALGAVIAIDPSAIDAVQSTLEDPVPAVRFAAVSTLGQFGIRAAQAVDSLTNLLNHADSETRSNILTSLAKIGPPAQKALPSIQAALSDPDLQVRTTATNCVRALDVAFP